MRTDRWAALERLVARQHGVAVAWQLRMIGIPRTTFSDYVQRHGWTVLEQGLWAAPWSEPSFARRCVIERIRGPRGRLITGGAMLMLLGARRLGHDTIDLWVRPGVGVAPRPDVEIHRSPWVSGDRVRRVDRIPCTPPLRALRDAARSSTVGRLERDLRALDRMRLATPESAREDLLRRGRFPGRPKLVEALDRVGVELVHSEAEATARRLLRTDHHPHPRPLLIRHRGRRLGEVDIPLCRIRYGVEVDGPSHREDGQAERDRARDEDLERLTGWWIDRFPDELLTSDPRAFVDAVRTGAAQAAARGLEPWPCRVCS